MDTPSYRVAYLRLKSWKREKISKNKEIQAEKGENCKKYSKYRHTSLSGLNCCWAEIQVLTDLSKKLQYVYVWVEEQKRILVLDFWVICKRVVIYCHLGLVWVYPRVFWGLTTLQNPPEELNDLLFCREHENKIEPSYQSFEQFVIFFLAVVNYCHLGPKWAYFGFFCDHTALRILPLELNSLKYLIL